MLTKGIEVMKYVRASAGRAGLNVIFENTNQPRHDGKTIYLPRIVAATTDEQLKQLMCSTDHEVAHDRFSSFELLEEKRVDPKSILMFVWNYLEDSRVNVIEAKEYKGFKDNWDECNSSLIESILSKSIKDTSSISKLTSALICWDSTVCAKYFPSIELVTSSYSPGINKKVMDVLNSYSDRLVHCHSILNKRLGTESTYDLALDILTKLGEDCKKELKEEKPSPSIKNKDKKEGKGDKEGAEKDAEEYSKDELSGSPEDKGDSESEKKAPEEEEYKVITIKLTEEDLKKFSLTMPEHGKEMSKIGVNFEPVALSTGTWDLTDYSKFVVINYPKNTGNVRFFQKASSYSKFKYEYYERVGKELVAQENFAQQVRKLIQIRARVQTQYGTKKGKLDQSRLSRICFNAPGFNERIFKKKIDNKVLDAAITVLVDMSGSMGGMKVYYALASTLLLNEVCSTLNIPLEILGFTDGTIIGGEINPFMYIYKGFSDLKVSSDDLIEYFAMSSSFMCGNPDGENIIWAHDRLVQRKEKKRMLIVMSDGSPAASKSSTGLERFTKKVIQEIEKSSIDIYGLGLCSPSVSMYYKSHSVVDFAEQIPACLLTLIEKKILNV